MPAVHGNVNRLEILPGFWAYGPELRREFLPHWDWSGEALGQSLQTSGCAARREKVCPSRAALLKTWTLRRRMEWAASSWPKWYYTELWRWSLNSQEEKDGIIRKTNLRCLYRWTKNLKTNINAYKACPSGISLSMYNKLQELCRKHSKLKTSTSILGDRGLEGKQIPQKR